MGKLTPLKAIRMKCLDCSETRTEVRNCTFNGKIDYECPLYNYRMGVGGGRKLKKIRAFCVWCCNGSQYEVRLCPSDDCSLWEYRLGKRPKTPALAETGSLVGGS